MALLNKTMASAMLVWILVKNGWIYCSNYTNLYLFYRVLCYSIDWQYFLVKFISGLNLRILNSFRFFRRPSSRASSFIVLFKLEILLLLLFLSPYPNTFMELDWECLLEEYTVAGFYLFIDFIFSLISLWACVAYF